MGFTGKQKKILREGIIGAYPTRDELEILLSDEMEVVNFEAIVREGDYNMQVFDLIQKFHTEGRLEDFIRAIVKNKPRSPMLDQIRREFAGVLNGGGPPGTKTPSGQTKYEGLVEEFINGDIVLFLGPGINPDFYIDSALRLTEYIAKDHNGINCPKENLITRLLGMPCQFCPYLPEHRPPECPMLKGTITLSSCPFYKEQQNLTVANMNLRYLSQYYKLDINLNTFYSKLRDIFGEIKSNAPNEVHHLLAQLPKSMKAKGYPKKSPGLPYQMIVTSNYNDLLEQAFEQAGQPYDVVYYVADGYENEKGKYKHQPYQAKAPRLIEEPDKYYDLPLGSPSGASGEPRPIILKLYGTQADKFAITEDQINYLASNPQPIKGLPNGLTKLLNECSILFLGYNPGDSDLQFLVRRIWSDCNKAIPGGSFLAHQSEPGDLGKRIWKEEPGVKLIAVDCSLVDFVTSLRGEIEARIESQQQ